MEPVIRTASLTKRFGKRTAVDELDLEVQQGSIFGFLGPNGAGKSTTIRLLLGLLRPNSGEAWVLGAPVPSKRLSVGGRVGALAESPAFYDYLSARRNLEVLSRLSGPLDRKRIDEVLELVGLKDRARDKVGAYSHGMRQRLGIAQALLPKPDLVILDEPANGLDPTGLVEVRRLMEHLRDAEGMTIFLSSHLLHEVELICTDVAVVWQGRIIRAGSVEELLRRPETELDIRVDDPERALQAIGELLFVQHAEVLNGVLRVAVEEGSAAEVNGHLVASGLRVSLLQPKASTLEETYLTLMAEHADAGSAAN